MPDPGSVSARGSGGRPALHQVIARAVPGLFAAAAAQADILVLCGDLTDYGLPEEAEILIREMAGGAKLPTIAVLGNHDFESGRQAEVKQMLVEAGVLVLDGDAVEVRGVGFAGAKGFAGGFGRGTLGAWGEPAVKVFVQEAVDEAMKLEAALARLRTDAGSRCSITRRSGRRSRTSRPRSSRSSGAAAWKTRSTAIRSWPSCTATPTTVPRRDVPAGEPPCITSRSRCSGRRRRSAPFPHHRGPRSARATKSLAPQPPVTGTHEPGRPGDSGVASPVHAQLQRDRDVAPCQRQRRAHVGDIDPQRGRQVDLMLLLLDEDLRGSARPGRTLPAPRIGGPDRDNSGPSRSRCPGRSGACPRPCRTP